MGIVAAVADLSVVNVALPTISTMILTQTACSRSNGSL